MIVFTAATPPTRHYYRPAHYSYGRQPQQYGRHYHHHHSLPYSTASYSYYDIDRDLLFPPPPRHYDYYDGAGRSCLAQPTTTHHYHQHSRRYNDNCCAPATPPAAYSSHPIFIRHDRQPTSNTPTRQNLCCTQPTTQTAAANRPTILDDIFSWWPTNAGSFHRLHPIAAAFFPQRDEEEEKQEEPTPLSYVLHDTSPHEILAALFGSSCDLNDSSSRSSHPDTQQQTPDDAQATTSSQHPQPASTGTPTTSSPTQQEGEAHQLNNNTTMPQPQHEHHSHHRKRQPRTRPHPVSSTRQASPSSPDAETCTAQSTSASTSAQDHTPDSPTNQHAEPASPLSLLWPFLTDDERHLLGLSRGSHTQRHSHNIRHHSRHSPQQQHQSRPQTSDHHAEEGQSSPLHHEEVPRPHRNSSETVATAAAGTKLPTSPTSYEATNYEGASPVNSGDSNVNGSPTTSTTSQSSQEKNTPPRLTFSSTHVTTVIGPDGVPVSERVHKFTDSDGHVKTLRTRSIGADSVTDGDAEQSDNTRHHTTVSSGDHDPTSSDAAALLRGKLSLEDFEKRWATTALGREDPKSTIAGGDDVEAAHSHDQQQGNQQQTESPVGVDHHQADDGTLLKTSSSAATA